MKANSVQLFQTASITYSWQPLAEFSPFYLKIFYRTTEKDEWDEFNPQTIYVNGDKSKLEMILAVWNESKNFRYEVKP